MAHFARGLILWTKAKGFPHEQAIRAFQKALELDPDADETHHQLSMVYSHVGLLDEARSHVARAIELNPNNTMARFRVSVYAMWQCRFEDALGTGFGHFHHPAYNIAATHAALLEPAEAVNWVEAAADDGFPCYLWFARDPNLKNLRGFPPFVELMSQLQNQWRHFKRIVRARRF